MPIDIQWKKAIRRIFRLPYRARSVLLPYISHSIPPSVLFTKSFVKFFINNMQSSNSIVKFVFQSALSNNTRLGNNFRYILYSNDLSLSDDCQIYMDTNSLCKVIMDKWNRDCDENTSRLATHILELIMRRDSLDPWILSKKEIQDVIDLISTS